jgi:hypothetical protein
MARIIRPVAKASIMGVSPSESVSQKNFFRVFDAAVSEGLLSYKSNAYKLLNPRIVDHHVREIFGQETRRDFHSADYAITGVKFSVDDEGKVSFKPGQKATGLRFWSSVNFAGDLDSNPTTVTVTDEANTLAQVAKAHEVATAQLAEWNGLRANARVDVGQELTIMTRSSMNMNYCWNGGSGPFNGAGGGSVSQCANGCTFGAEDSFSMPQATDLIRFLPEVFMSQAASLEASYNGASKVRSIHRGISMGERAAAAFLGDLVMAQAMGRGPLLELPKNVINWVAEDLNSPQHKEFLSSDGSRNLDTAYQAMNFYSRFVPARERIASLRAIDNHFGQLLLAESPPEWMTWDNDAATLDRARGRVTMLRHPVPA